MAGGLVVNRLDHGKNLTMGREVKDAVVLGTLIELVIICPYCSPHLGRIGRAQYYPLWMENTDTYQLVVLADHGQDRAHILDVTQMHGIVDTVLYRVQEEFGAFAGAVYELGLLMPDVEESIEIDTANKEGDRGKNDSGSQALEHSIPSPGIGSLG